MKAGRFCALLLAAWLSGGAALAAEDQPSAAQMMDDLMYGRGPIGGPFTLTDHTGRLRSDSEFRGRLMIVYFGYTFCPDVCPTDLQAITQALNALGPRAAEVQPIFITVDPERDTKVLADYVSAFHPSLIGLTGSPEQIRKVANSYKAFYAKVGDERTGEYSIDHAGVIYLMGRNGEYLGFMPPQTGPERLTEIIRTHLAK
ncbi:MAG TPA: SCO family protein [Bradyrhizobium sp.]|jgi:protein SCO1/2|nr:SCO family protein [Bradyrhizobium sp.]